MDRSDPARARPAAGELNELGIAKADRAELLDWLDSLGRMPSPDDLLQPDGRFHPAGEIWARAVSRMAQEGIQKPLKTDRPLLANDPGFAALYGIQSFLWGFHRNILRRTLRRGAEGKGVAGRAGIAARNAAWATPAMAALFAGQLLSTIAREALLNSETWEEKEEDDELIEWLLSRAFSRTGLTGVWDPLIQLVTAIKYQRDLTAITAGPHLGYFLQNAASMMQPFVGRNSPNTTAAENSAVRAGYQALIQPLFMQAAASILPGGGLATAAVSAPFIWYMSGPDVSQHFADALVGEKRRYERGEDRFWSDEMRAGED